MKYRLSSMGKKKHFDPGTANLWRYILGIRRRPGTRVSSEEEPRYRSIVRILREQFGILHGLTWTGHVHVIHEVLHVCMRNRSHPLDIATHSRPLNYRSLQIRGLRPGFPLYERSGQMLTSTLSEVLESPSRRQCVRRPNVACTQPNVVLTRIREMGPICLFASYCRFGSLV